MHSDIKVSEIIDAPVCSDMSQESVEALVRHLEVRQYQKDEVLYREESQEDNDLLIILDGQLEISTQHRYGMGGILKIKLDPGDVAGIMGFVGGKPHIGTACAASDCRVARLSREQFAHLCQKHPEITIPMLRFLAVALDRFFVMVLDRYNDSLTFMHGTQKP